MPVQNFSASDALRFVHEFFLADTSFYLEIGDLLGVIAVRSKEGQWFLQGGDWGDPHSGPYTRSEAEAETTSRVQSSKKFFGSAIRPEWYLHKFDTYDEGHHHRYDAWRAANPDALEEDKHAEYESELLSGEAAEEVLLAELGDDFQDANEPVFEKMSKRSDKHPLRVWRAWAAGETGPPLVAENLSALGTDE